ncbi:hypothetical protein PVAP13_9KG600300 [Panicum virgatum]|uniref:Uncharacterized protein n=1 Tax=Panicum virgatum TaxID=38727 RepID=A0A8T0NXA4_PANVG|nr:hypothetical protein PVAP13_9KG600300 [Panicum virgatum]
MVSSSGTAQGPGRLGRRRRRSEGGRKVACAARRLCAAGGPGGLDICSHPRRGQIWGHPPRIACMQTGSGAVTAIDGWIVSCIESIHRCLAPCTLKILLDQDHPSVSTGQPS